MGWVLRILINAFAVWVAVQLVDGLHFDGEWWQLLLIGLVFGIINSALKPLLRLLSLPLLAVTLGLFSLVINWALFALTIWLAAPERLDLGMTSDSFLSTFLGALIVSVVSWMTGLFVND